MSNFEKILASFKEMEKSRKLLHGCVHNIYRNEVEKYEEWRQSEDCRQLISSQLQILGDCCPICLESLSPEKATIDHLEPKRNHISKTLDKSNFLVMCAGCNQLKYSTPFKTWRNRLNQFCRDSLDYAIIRIHGKAKLEALINETPRK